MLDLLLRVKKGFYPLPRILNFLNTKIKLILQNKNTLAKHLRLSTCKNKAWGL